MDRRSLILGSAAFLAASRANADVLLREADIGDPSTSEVEDINLTVDQVARIEDLTGGIPGTARDATLYVKIKPKDVFLQALAVAGAEADAGISRAANPARVTEYLNLFGLDFADAATGKPYAYCAAGLSWALCKAYCDKIKTAGGDQSKYDYVANGRLKVFQYTLPVIRALYIRPHPQVQVIAEDAHKRVIWQPATITPLPGWIVFYNWSGGSNGQHIGIVETASANSLRTIEFNTTIKIGSQINGGYVARKDRTSDRGRVLGYAATY